MSRSLGRCWATIVKHRCLAWHFFKGLTAGGTIASGIRKFTMSAFHRDSLVESRCSSIGPKHNKIVAELEQLSQDSIFVDCPISNR